MSIEAKNLIKDFSHQRVLHGIDISIQPGDFFAISGRSGSGKSTLLYILSTLDVPTEGNLIIDGINTKEATKKELDDFRGREIGFIFQFHYLLPELTALENILLPARNYNLENEKKESALALLEELEIPREAHKYPSQMSGGQQQRVAIARSLIMKPKYIFADEPTGNLDSYNAIKVMNILKNKNQQDNTTIILVSHEPDFTSMAKREIFLVDGRIDSQR